MLLYSYWTQRLHAHLKLLLSRVLDHLSTSSSLKVHFVLPDQVFLPKLQIITLAITAVDDAFFVGAL